MSNTPEHPDLRSGSEQEPQVDHLGLIQPHGALLVLDPDGRVEQRSDNVEAVLGAPCPPGIALGELIEKASLSQVDSAFSDLATGLARPRFTPIALRTAGGRALAAVPHALSAGQLRLLELETLPEPSDASGYELLAPHLDSLRDCITLDELYDEAARVARRISGWDRAVLLRFDADGAGEVVAEVTQREPSYRGMRFPAVDVPEKLRRLYQHERVRCIVDATAPAAKLSPLANPRTSRPVPLEAIGLRGAAAPFLDMLSALDIASSLTTALLAGDGLAGLLVCYNHAPAAPPSFAVRQACELLGVVVSTRRAELGEVQRLRAQVRAGARRSQLLARLNVERPSPARLLSGEPNLLDLIPASGAAWVGEQRVVSTGKTPSTAALLDLARWLDTEVARPSFATRSLEQVYPAARELRDSCAGLLALQLPQPDGGWLLWLRPELPSTVAWGKTSEENASTSAAGGAKRSFAAWQRSVEGTSAVWSKEERDAASALRDGLVELALVRAEQSRRELELERRQARRLETLGLLASGFANDFNNLLLAIQANAVLAQDELQAGGDVQPFLEQIDGAVTRGARLTNQMLAFSGRNVATVEAVDLSAMVQRLALLDGMIAPGATLERELTSDLPELDIDVTQVQQMVVNLVLNASESLQGDHGTITVATGEQQLGEPLGELDPGRYVYLDVVDTGCGMDETTKQQLFEPFFTTKEKRPASTDTPRGIGMSAVIGAARSHGGGVVVDSVPGRGTSVRVLLPVSSSPTSHEHDELPAAEVGGESRTVLIVDDEELVRNVAMAALKREGWRGIPAVDGSEALALFEQHRAEIDLVLLDLTLPGLGGGEVWRALREQAPDVKVLFSSGLSTKALPAEAVEAGCAFLQKPYKPDALLAHLRRTLG
jgi:light-regulated signal transduction histidine kinase (bacteriophytochrome)/CheY-like chemotaxis protein